MDESLRRARIGVTLAFVVNGFTAGTFVARIPDIKSALGISDGGTEALPLPSLEPSVSLSRYHLLAYCLRCNLLGLLFSSLDLCWLLKMLR
nr:hypothetical protein [Actinomycetota bacterium]